MATEVLGEVREIRRYPVRSMRGELLESAEIGKLGLVGDRAWGVVPEDAFEIASASKSPKQWGSLLEFQASFVEKPRLGAPPPPVSFVHDGGETLRSDTPDFPKELSRLLGTPATLFAGDTSGSTAAMRARAEAEAAGDADAVPASYISAPVHLLTTASLTALASRRPEHAFAAERFRPNLLVDAGVAEGFVEAAWVGSVLRIGSAELHVFMECPRCGLTTLSQAGLAKDPGVLRAIAEENETNLGVVAQVTRTGRLRVGDVVERIGSA